MPSRLTTIDNPYDPFDEFKQWFQYDFDAGYHTPGYLARIIITSDELSAAMQEQANEEAIDEILQYNPLGIYKKVTRAA